MKEVSYKILLSDQFYAVIYWSREGGQRFCMEEKKWNIRFFKAPPISLFISHFLMCESLSIFNFKYFVFWYWNTLYLVLNVFWNTYMFWVFEISYVQKITFAWIIMSNKLRKAIRINHSYKTIIGIFLDGKLLSESPKRGSQSGMGVAIGSSIRANYLDLEGHAYNYFLDDKVFRKVSLR